MTNEEVSLYLAMPDGERYRQLLLKDAEIERLRKGLEDAAYALFQLKRMTPDGAPEFARMASDRAQEVLEGHAHEPCEQLNPFDSAAILAAPRERRISMSFETQEQYEAALVFLDMADEGASRDASPADLVGALQDVVHTDPGPVRAGHAVKSIECPQCFGDKQIAMSDWTSRTCEYCGGTGRVIPTSK